MAKPTAEDALTEEELNRLLAQPNPRYPTGQRNLALLVVMADGGLRLSEAINLTTRDLVEEGGQLTHLVIRSGKRGKPGKIALTRRAAAKLGGWLQARGQAHIESDFIFCTISKGRAAGGFARPDQKLAPGRKLIPSYVRQMVKRLANKANISRNISPHTLRHTFATRYLRATGNLELTRKALRHADIQTTARIYSHLVQEDVDKGIRQLPGNEEEPPPEADQIQQLAEALARLAQEQREALAAALQATE